MAHHYDRGGDARQAVEYLGRAGVRAAQQLAQSEAIGYWTRALELLKLLPESPERDRRELELRQSVWMMFLVTKGNATPEAIDSNRRVATLAEKHGNLRLLVIAVTQRSATAFGLGDLPAAGALADRALELALREGTATGLTSAYQLQIATRHIRGDLAGVEQHFTAGFKFFDDPGVRQIPGLAIPIFACASHNAWALGRTDLARERDAQMMASVNESNPYNVAFSGLYAANLRLLMREHEPAEAWAAQAFELAEKHQFRDLAAYCRCILGLARAQLGRATEGVELIRRGIAGRREIGQRVGISSLLTNLAAAQAREGVIVDALETVEQALQANPDELIYRPETLRLRGELRLIQGQTELAEAGFREAIALAQKIGAKAWELRATTSLADMLAKHGRRDEARAMLAEIYGWFTEGFDTADLKDAKALLDELNA